MNRYGCLVVGILGAVLILTGLFVCRLTPGPF